MTRPSARLTSLSLLLSFAAAACGGSDGPQTDAEHQASVLGAMKANLTVQIDRWLAAATALRDAAPTPADRGWDPVADAASLTAMRASWADARAAYERIEGIVAPLFPDTDVATDARYDDYMEELRPNGDPNPFDDAGVTGMHAIERVLWANQVPPAVIAFEQALPGYTPPAFPASATEASEFKQKLATRMITDVQALKAALAPLGFDVGTAWNGMIDLVAEQTEKVNKAATGEEESRYAQTTMRDLRFNYEGCRAQYLLFRDWVLSKGDAGRAADAAVTTAFARLASAYERVTGDAIPQPPASWSSLAPTADDLATPFGQLWQATNSEADEAAPGTLAHALVSAMTLLGYQRSL